METHSVARCPSCGGVVFVSKYLRNFIVSLPLWAYVLGLQIVRWTGHLLVDWMLLVGLGATLCAMFGLDALLPRSLDESIPDKWWYGPVVVSPVFVFAIAIYFMKDSDLLRSLETWMIYLVLVLAVCASIALEQAVQKS